MDLWNAKDEEGNKNENGSIDKSPMMVIFKIKPFGLVRD